MFEKPCCIINLAVLAYFFLKRKYQNLTISWLNCSHSFRWLFVNVISCASVIDTTVYMCTDIRYSIKHAFSCRIITQILHHLKSVTRVVAKTIQSVIKLFTCVDSTHCCPLPRLYLVPIGQEMKYLRWFETPVKSVCWQFLLVVISKNYVTDHVVWPHWYLNCPFLSRPTECGRDIAVPFPAAAATATAAAEAHYSKTHGPIFKIFVLNESW